MARARSHSGSTLKATLSNEDNISPLPTTPGPNLGHSVRASLSVHDDAFSREPILFAESYLASSGVTDGTLVEIRQLLETTDVRDFENSATSTYNDTRHENGKPSSARTSSLTYLCIARTASTEQANKQHNLEVSISKQIANNFNLVSRAQVMITVADKRRWSSSHVEISFRDAYLSRSDMWRFVSQELVGKTVYAGQRLSFLNTLKATVRTIHVQGRHSQVAYFDNSTVPVFRSEAARYVIFIQMSREMWDFDSEGNGEILFNRVVNGFLPELFKRWSSIEVRHLVSIVMFGRLEYRRSDLADSLSPGFRNDSPTSADMNPVGYQDFYRVVVTDMASAQWATILEELKKDFRVFLRDVSLFKTPDSATGLKAKDQQERPTRITGRLSGALKGNILEAINLAASQFSNDYIDRDLIRTGISTIVITAGSGVFDVDQDLLRLTSETLTNNGIGIDVVCLSKMPLHSVPLFRYRLNEDERSEQIRGFQPSTSPSSVKASLPRASLTDLSHSPAFSSTNASVNYFSRFPTAFPSNLPQLYGYGIPQWIDLSYWSPEMSDENFKHRRRLSHLRQGKFRSGSLFIPRVRMYELQMMGLMEMRMAEIVVPYLTERTFGDDLDISAWNPRASQSQYSRSFSRSPELRKKSSVLARQRYGQSEYHRDQKSIDAGIAAEMDRYDDAVFEAAKPRSRKEKAQRRARKTKLRKPRIEVDKEERVSPPLAASSQVSTLSSKKKLEADSRSIRSTATSVSTAPQRPARAPRSISYMLRGLTPMKAAAITPEVSVENVAAQRPINDLTDLSSDESRPKLKSRIESSRSSRLTLEHDENSSTSSRPSTATSRAEGSKPIKINAAGSSILNESSITKQLWQKRRQDRHDGPSSTRRSGEELSSDSDELLSNTSTAAESNLGSLPAGSIPFIRNVNASNPLKRRNDLGTFGRWQHLYPRKPRAATVKWRSLCTPASVPLTTEDFPSRDELENDYNTISHVARPYITDEKTADLEAETHALFLEMISLRVAHGYQFVTGGRVAETIEEQLADLFAVYQQDARSKPRLVVVLAMANIIQKLDLHRASRVCVTKYVQRLNDKISVRKPIATYSPYVRTILSKDYFSRSFQFRGFSEHYPWDTADHHLAGEDEEPRKVVEQLRFWRARYVLLPVEPPTSTWKTPQSDETEEEIHLLGIRALTLLWQKNRYTSPDERRILLSRTGSAVHRDPNPLEIKMETVNPAELVASELDRLAQIEEAEHESMQLLPEPQKLDRESSMQKFAIAMQSERGIDIKSRKWHWKLYYNCFHGEEFTNWLLHNVKDLNQRKDAVEFGNQLMKEGLFEHVTSRHRFKDGNYFYSIRPDFRTARPDQNKIWFLNSRQNNKTLPPTPIAEQPSRDSSPLTIRTRSGSNIAQQLHASSASDNTPAVERKRKAVSLSRMIRVDVDPRKKSFLSRPEVIHVHYDRFHNPENCYHIELNWLSTTCKLVDDAILTWTNTAEKYGLKLVEVPIAEAYDVPIAEPFRNPYTIKLALEPPKHKMNNVMFNTVNFSSTSFGSHQQVNVPPVGKHIYQKAILKRSNFVLDLEAANEFPEGVDIHYSWGQLDYKYTQFVHRSGVVLAQILDNGDIILLANRLYNSRLANTKEAGSRIFDAKRDTGPHASRPAVPPSVGASMQASGIVGINLASPGFGSSSSPGLNPVPNIAAYPSPLPRPFGIHHTLQSTPLNKPVIADSFGPRSAFAATGLWNTLITPEQIKDDLETFCHDKVRLEQFYREVANAPTPVSAGPGSGSRKTTGSSSSSLLRPIREVPGTMAGDITGIPGLELPEAVTTPREMRRNTVAYESVADLLDRTRIGSRNGSVGSGNDNENGRSSSVVGAASPLRKATK